MRRAAALALVVCASAACAQTARAADWVGTYAVPSAAAPVAISIQVRGGKAVVALGAGHSSARTVPVSTRGARLRFVFPDRLAFDGRIRGRTLAGRVSQGKLRGTFRLVRGTSRLLPLLGLYRGAGGTGVAIVKPETLSPWLLELPSGRVHGIGPALTVGLRLGDTAGNGTIGVDGAGISWNGAHYDRVELDQREVRVGVDAATLTLPRGPGPFAAVAMAHGAGPHTREEFQAFAAYCELLGIAVLADDKRGVGESGGTYPGERATDSTVDVLARDAQAEARYLAALPRVDAARVGLLGDSQAGWIIALAAAREHAVRWAVPLVGPAVSEGETDFFAELAGKSIVPPSGTREQMLAQVRRSGPSGFDPRPYLRMLAIPVFWVYGDDDRNVPTELCVEALQALQAGHDFSWAVLHMTHTPLELPTGLLSSLPQSSGFEPGFYPAIGTWLRARGIAAD